MMKIELINKRGETVIVLAGDIDMHTSPELRKELMSHIHRKVTPLYVDFLGVSYIDSSGIATFVEGLKCVKAYGGRLKLVGIPEGIMEIFCFAKLDRVFEIYGTLDDALGS